MRHAPALGTHRGREEDADREGPGKRQCQILLALRPVPEGKDIQEEKLKFELSLYNKVDGKMVSAYGLTLKDEAEFRRRICNLAKRHNLTCYYRDHDKIVYKNPVMSLVGNVCA